MTEPGGETAEREWFAANRAMWDERVGIHVGSRFYDVDGFLAGRDTLQPFEVAEVGDVRGKSLVHLQCHFGLDTLSRARRGARVTGLDFSPPAIEAARDLARRANVDAEFVEANVYDAAEALGGRQFEVVYTGLGALVWLPDIDRWAKTVAKLVAPGGFLYLAEFHPFIDVFSYKDLSLAYGYFDRKPIFDEDPGTYADLDAATVHNRSYQWMHPLGEVVSAVIAAGLRLDFLHEHDYTLWQRWPFMVEDPPGVYHLPAGTPSLPLMYSLRASSLG